MPPTNRGGQFGQMARGKTIMDLALQQLHDGLSALEDVKPRDPPFKPHPGPQSDFVYSDATITVFGGSAGGGKLLALDTPIATVSGWTTMGEIQVGDEVFDGNGKPCRVIAVHDIEESPERCYRMEFDDGSAVDAGGEHLWLTYDSKDLGNLLFKSEEWKAKRRAKRPRRVSGNKSQRFTESLSKRNSEREYETLPAPTGSIRTTDEISATLTVRGGSRLNHAIPVTGALDLPARSLPLDPYLLGVWLGDGHSASGKITSADEEIFDAFVSAGFSLGERYRQLGSKASSISALGLTSILRKIGVLGDKRIPQEYLRSSAQDRMALLCGLMDTDGTVAKGSGSAEFCTTSKNLADGFYELVCSLGWKVRIRQSRAKLNGKDCGPKWTFKWTPSEPVFRLKRKLDRQKKGTRQTLGFRYVKSCDRIPPVPMRCISVDSESRLYLAGRQMVPTHNTAGIGLRNSRFVHIPGFNSVVFRRKTTDLRMPGGLWARSHEVYPMVGGVAREDRLEYRFPSGATVRHSHMEHENNRFDWSGSEITHVAFDEVQSFTADMFWFLTSRNRSTCGVQPFISATCLDGGTYLQAGDGRLIRIDRCGGLDREILAVSPWDCSVAPDRPTHFHRRKVSAGKRIVTNQGEITCTADHRLFAWTPDGPHEVAAEDIKPGQCLASVRRVQHGSEEIDPDESYLVGYTVGDGGISGRRNIPRLFWTEHDEGHARYIASVAERVLGTKIGVHKRTSDCFAIYATSGRSGGNKAFISRYQPAVASGLLRSIPEDITAGNEESCRGLLQGVFDAEGSVGQTSIALAVISKAVAQQVSMLLRRWGIVAAYCVSDPQPPRHRVYRLSLSGRQAVSFVRHIGFRMERKQKKALELAERLKRGSAKRAQELDKIPIDRKRISHLSGYFGKSWWNKNRAIRLDTALAALRYATESGLDPRPLERWAAYSWQKVRKVEDVPLEEAFDVTIPSTHVYIAGNLLSHNCNPDPDSFIFKLIEWWIDPDTGLAIPERSGKVRWILRADDDKFFWGDTPEQAKEEASKLVRGARNLSPMSFTFIHSSLADNPTLTKNDPHYIVKLQNLPLVERERLLGGNWHIRPSAGKVFNREWFNQRVPSAPPGVGPDVRGWDKAASAEGGDRTASVKLRKGADGKIYVLHAFAFRASYNARDEVIRSTAERDSISTQIELEQEPGSGGKESLESTVAKLVGFIVKWSYPTGSKVARWQPAASQAEAGNVVLVDDGTWDIDAFVAELHNSDGSNNVFDDYTDAFAAAIRGLGKSMTRAIW